MTSPASFAKGRPRPLTCRSTGETSGSTAQHSTISRLPVVSNPHFIQSTNSIQSECLSSPLWAPALASSAVALRRKLTASKSLVAYLTGHEMGRGHDCAIDPASKTSRILSGGPNSKGSTCHVSDKTSNGRDIDLQSLFQI